MSTFAKPRSLTDRITDALAAVRALRDQGNPDHVTKATNWLDGLLDRYPRRENGQPG